MIKNNRRMTYDFTKPTDYMKAAILGVKRRERFIEGYEPATELREICNKYFSNRNLLEEEGLSTQFNKMKRWMEENGEIGLILLGTDPGNFPHNYQNFIGNYTTQMYIKIKLTVEGICQFLVLDYIGLENIEKLCEKSYNFKDYLRYIRENSSFSL